MEKQANKLQQLVAIVRDLTEKRPKEEPVKIPKPTPELSPARKKAMRIYAALIKRADDYPELSGRRGAGQRFFEGTMGGAGKGLMAGSLLGALLGGYGGYQQSQKADTVEKIKAILKGALSGAAAGGGAGAGVGAGPGGAASTLFGSRRQQPTY